VYHFVIIDAQISQWAKAETNKTIENEHTSKAHTGSPVGLFEDLMKR